jgi:hypothetical protein
MSRWRDNAEELLRNNDVNSYLHDVTAYLIRHAYGKENRVSIQSLCNLFDPALSREMFQYEILIPLKQHNIIATLIYPGPQGGVFIPKDEDEIIVVLSQIKTRFIEQTSNIIPLCSGTRFESDINELLTYIQDWTIN